MIEALETGRRSPIARFLVRPETLIILALTFASLAACLVARETGPFQTIEAATLDWRFRVRGPQPAAAEVMIVAIDDRTLAQLGRWPFSRTWLAQAIDAIAEGGARVVVLDLLLVGSEAMSVVSADGSSGASEVDRSRSVALTESDRALADAIARAAAVVVPYAFVFDPAKANALALPEPIESTAYRTVHSDFSGRQNRDDHPAGILAPLTPFLAAGWPAHVTVFVEADGSLRFAHPVIRYGEDYYPSLAIEAVRLFLGVDRGRLALDLGRAVSIGDHRVSTDARMRLAINYAGPIGTFASQSLIDIVTGRVPGNRFREKIVLVGVTAAGLGDRFVTPYSPSLPGVETFANMIDNVLGHSFLRRSPLTENLDLLAIALGGVLAALMGLLGTTTAVLIATILLVTAWSAVNLYAFVALQTWLNFTFPCLVMLLGAGVVMIGRAFRESRLRTEADRRREILSRYVSPLTAAGLRQRPASGTSERTQMAAIMFVDLVGFTRASEVMTPAETAELLGRFHRCVEHAADANNGVIDKFIGDGALVVFGVPASGPIDAANAVRCARQIAEEVSGRREQQEGDGQPVIDCGIGIHFGPVAIAEVGGSGHAQITVTGDTVNIASRLEALTRSLSTTIIVSDAVIEAARPTGAKELLESFRALPGRQIRGRERPIGIWAWPPPRVMT